MSSTFCGCRVRFNCSCTQRACNSICFFLRHVNNYVHFLLMLVEYAGIKNKHNGSVTTAMTVGGVRGPSMYSDPFILVKYIPKIMCRKCCTTWAVFARGSPHTATTRLNPDKVGLPLLQSCVCVWWLGPCANCLVRAASDRWVPVAWCGRIPGAWTNDD